MEQQYYWLDRQGNIYGPFGCDNDGNPRAGDVVRYYRLQRGMSCAELGAALGKTARWVQAMEANDTVPEMISRRKAIALAIEAPLFLLGLAGPGELIMKNGDPPIAPTLLLKRGPDFESYEDSLRLLWQLNVSSTAQGSTSKIKKTISELTLSCQSNPVPQALSLLDSYCRLLSQILRDTGDYASAAMYADRAVDAATHLQDHERMAAAFYNRAHVVRYWATYGTQSEQGFLLDLDKVRRSVGDFELALKHGSPQQRGITLLELSYAQGLLGASVQAQDTLEKAVQAEKAMSVDDPARHIARSGTLGMTKGRRLLGSAFTMMAVGRPGRAIDDIDDLEELRTDGLPRSQTRQHAWVDIARAQAALRCKDRDLYTACYRLSNAFMVCRDIESTTNLRVIADVHRQCTAIDAKNREVRALGDLLYAKP